MAGASLQDVTVSGTEKPKLSILSIFNMALGFFGLQIAFALQNANASPIFQTLGADVDKLAVLWLAGPLTGLLVQPIVGYFSDRAWGRFGRRRPYFFVGAILAAIALIAMPTSPLLWMAVSMLWILDASINISMEPFRAFVGDNLPSSQRTLGYAMQGALIGVGGWLGSVLPNILADGGLAVTAAEGVIPDNVKYAFFIGAGLLVASMMWTIFFSKEYSPDDIAAFEAADNSEMAQLRQQDVTPPHPSIFTTLATIFLGLGGVVLGIVAATKSYREPLFLGLALVIAGGLFLWNAQRIKAGGKAGMVGTIMDDLVTMPTIMKRLALVQFCCWFSLFTMWVFAVPALAGHHFGGAVAGTADYANAQAEIGNMFGTYNLVPIFFSLFIPIIARAIGLKLTYMLGIVCGGLGLLALFFLPMGQYFGNGPAVTLGAFTFFETKLLLSALGIGIAWSCILTLPYSILADALPAEKMGTYMGIFNFFIVLPQMVNALVMGPLIRSVFGGQAIYAIVTGGIVMLIGAVVLLFFVPYKDPHKA